MSNKFVDHLNIHIAPQKGHHHHQTSKATSLASTAAGGGVGSAFGVTSQHRNHTTAYLQDSPRMCPPRGGESSGDGPRSGDDIASHSKKLNQAMVVCPAFVRTSKPKTATASGDVDVDDSSEDDVFLRPRGGSRGSEDSSPSSSSAPCSRQLTMPLTDIRNTMAIDESSAAGASGVVRSGSTASHTSSSAAAARKITAATTQRKAVKVNDILSLGSFGANHSNYYGGGGVTAGVVGRGRSLSHQSATTTTNRSFATNASFQRGLRGGGASTGSASVSGGTTPQMKAQQQPAVDGNASEIPLHISLSSKLMLDENNISVPEVFKKKVTSSSQEAGSSNNNNTEAATTTMTINATTTEVVTEETTTVAANTKTVMPDPLITPLAQHYYRLVAGSASLAGGIGGKSSEGADGGDDEVFADPKSKSGLRRNGASAASLSSAGFVVIDSLSQAIGESAVPPPLPASPSSPQRTAMNNPYSISASASPSIGIPLPHQKHHPSAAGRTTSMGAASNAASPPHSAAELQHYFPFSHNGATTISKLLVRRHDIAAAEEQVLIANAKRRQAAIQRMKHLRLIQLGLASSAQAAGLFDASSNQQQQQPNLRASSYGFPSHSSELLNLCPEMALIDSQIAAPMFEESDDDDSELLLASGEEGGTSASIAAATAAALAAAEAGSPSSASPASNNAANRAASPLSSGGAVGAGWNDFSPSENWATMRRLGFPCSHKAEVVEAEYNAQAALTNEMNTCDYHWNLSLRGVAILGSATVETCEQLRKLARKYGIPSHLRHLMWMTLSGVSLKMDENEGFFKCITEKFGLVTGPSQEVIEKDLERTFPDHPYFAPGEPGVHRLRLILHALCWRNPLLGYCQSFNFIAAILILVLNDDEGTFAMMCHILENLLPNDYYSEGLMGIKIDQKVFVLFLDDYLPRVAAHFEDINFDVRAIIPAWLMSLYVNTFPIETLLRIWDYMAIEKSTHYSTVPIAIALAFFKLYQDDILRTRDPGDVMMLLNRLAACEYDGAKLVKTAHEFDLKPSVLHNMRRKVREEILIETEKRRRAREKFEAERKQRLQNLAMQKAQADAEKEKQMNQHASNNSNNGDGAFGSSIDGITAMQSTSSSSFSGLDTAAATNTASPTLQRRAESTLAGNGAPPSLFSNSVIVGASSNATASSSAAAVGAMLIQSDSSGVKYSVPHGHDRIAESEQMRMQQQSNNNTTANNSNSATAGGGSVKGSGAGAARVGSRPLHHTDPNHPSNATSKRALVTNVVEMKDLLEPSSGGGPATVAAVRAVTSPSPSANASFTYPSASSNPRVPNNNDLLSSFRGVSNTSPAPATVSANGSTATSGGTGRGNGVSPLPMHHPMQPKRTFY